MGVSSLPTREAQAKGEEMKRATLVALSQNPVLRAAYAVNRTLGSNPNACALFAIARVGLLPDHLPPQGGHALELGPASKQRRLEGFGSDLAVHLEQGWLQEINMTMHALGGVRH